MKYAIKYLLISSLAMGSLQAAAYEQSHNRGFYMGVALGVANFDDEFHNDHYHDSYYHEHDDSASPTLIEIKLGYDFSPFLAMEAQYGTELSSDSYHYEEGTEDVSVKNYSGFYVKPQLALGNLKVYALLGTAAVDLELTELHRNRANNRTTLFEDQGFSYGAGFSYRFVDHFRVNVEVKELPTLKGFDLADVSFGLEFEF